MSLKVERISVDFPDMQKLAALNKEAFPANERENIADFLEYAEQGICDFLGFYDKNIFVGFTLLAVNEKTAYLCYFAVDGKLRSQGYGSEVLSLLKKRYSNKQIVIDIERDDENSKNIEQRIKRKEFYIRNGFKESGFTLSYDGFNFEILFYGNTFDSNSYTSLFHLAHDADCLPSLDAKG